MITIAWYNIVAIVAGILFLVWLRKEAARGSAWVISKWWASVKQQFILALAVIFYAIWGGIFWW